MRQVQAERFFRPLQHDELQGGAGAPEQRGHGQRNLAELVAPQRGKAIRELGDQLDRVLFLLRVAGPRLGDEQVEHGRDHVEQHDHHHGCLGRGVDARVDVGNIDAEQKL